MSKVVETAEPTEVVKKPKALNEHVQRIREAIFKDGIEGDASGVITETKSNYIDLMPEGITPETDKAHTDYRSHFAAGSLVAMADLTSTLMAKHQDLQTVTADFAMGADTVYHAITREKESKFTVGDETRTSTKIGSARTDINVRGGQNVGQLKIARNMVSDIISEALGKK